MNLEMLLSKYGLGATLAVGLLTLVGFFVKWLLSFINKLIDQSKIERESFLITLKGFLASMGETNASIKNLHDNTVEAHRWQRDEYITIAGILEKIEVALARLNGRRN